jgi:hypothetical protein
METLETENVENVACFSCKLCNYVSSSNYNLNKHNKTKKHLLRVAGNNTETGKYDCLDCGKKYKNRDGLWKHSKLCGKQEQHEIKQTTNKNSDDIVSFLIQQNAEFKELLIEQNKTLIEVCRDKPTISHTQNNTMISNNKNSFNLQFFLNEKCKNAANLSDFVNSIELNLCDLENVGKLGYVEGISNIIIGKLKLMDVYSRPIHCADLKREIIYIKENDVWTKEHADNKRLKKSIKDIAFRNCRNFHLFKEKHPECVKSDSVHSDQYLKILAESIGGKGVHNIDNNDNKIIKKIAREMFIDKINYQSLTL